MTFGNPKRGETAYCAVTYLWSFTRADLGLPDDASNAELEAAATAMMEQITDYIAQMANIFPNDLEVSVG
jgi:hypothetical protein